MNPISPSLSESPQNSHFVPISPNLTARAAEQALPAIERMKSVGANDDDETIKEKIGDLLGGAAVQRRPKSYLPSPNPFGIPTSHRCLKGVIQGPRGEKFGFARSGICVVIESLRSRVSTDSYDSKNSFGTTYVAKNFDRIFRRHLGQKSAAKYVIKALKSAAKEISDQMLKSKIITGGVVLLSAMLVENRIYICNQGGGMALLMTAEGPVKLTQYILPDTSDKLQRAGAAVEEGAVIPYDGTLYRQHPVAYFDNGSRQVFVGRGMGYQSPVTSDPMITYIESRKGETLLLLSKGLVESATTAEIEQVYKQCLSEFKGPNFSAEVAKSLTAFGLARSDDNNVSVVAMQL